MYIIELLMFFTAKYKCRLNLSARVSPISSDIMFFLNRPAVNNPNFFLYIKLKL